MSRFSRSSILAPETASTANTLVDAEARPDDATELVMARIAELEGLPIGLSPAQIARRLAQEGWLIQRPVSMWEAGTGLTYRKPTAADVKTRERRSWHKGSTHAQATFQRLPAAGACTLCGVPWSKEHGLAHAATRDSAVTAQATITRVYSEDELREAIRRAYEDAARIVMEPRGKNPNAWFLEVGGMAERIAWRGEHELATPPGQGALPGERLTAHARGLPVPTTLAEVEALGLRRRS